MTQVLTPQHLESWGLSPQATSLLIQEPELLANLAEERERPPLPPGYIPQVVEVLFDDLPYIRSDNGIVSCLRDCPADYAPTFVEFRLDGETAMFQVGGEYVINRMAGIADVLALEGYRQAGGPVQ